MDILRELGPLCLGSRLKRVAEKLQQGVQQAIDTHDLPVAANQYPLLEMLARSGEQSVNELASGLGISQPGITRMLGHLAEKSLIGLRSDQADGRRRLVVLTDAGERLLDYSRRRLWPAVEAAVVDSCGGDAAGLLDRLDQLERQLAERDLAARIADKGTGHASA